MPSADPLPPGLAATDAAAALAGLRQRFIQGLGARWIRIAGADPTLRDQALHQLVGAAGAHGLTALEQAARLAEACAARGDGSGLRQALADLHQALLAAQRGSP